MSQQTTEQTIKVGVIGAGGRMGRMLIEAVQNKLYQRYAIIKFRHGIRIVHRKACRKH